MKSVRVVHEGAGIQLGSRVVVAESWWGRLRGLLARPPMRVGEGLLLLRCASVHTLGMTYPIDVAFLDADGTIVRRIACLAPYRIGVGGPEAVHALELPAGRLDDTGTVAGVRLRWS
jgi:hypothetical protein